jgi:hypothetical protein
MRAPAALSVGSVQPAPGVGKARRAVIWRARLDSNQRPED